MEDVGAAAAACLAQPEEHNGQTYRLGYQAATYHDIARIFTEVIGQPFSYEARPPEEFYRNVLAAGVLDLAHLYAAYVNDREAGTHHAPNFADAVRIHRLIDIISKASLTGTRETL